MIGHPVSARLSNRACADATLMRRLAQGDLSALGELYDRHAAGLLRFAARISTSGDAEDVVHDVFLRVVRLADEFDASATSARPWLYALTRRAAQERRRSLRRWAAALLQLSGQSTPGMSLLRETNRDLERAIERLHLKKREVLLLAEVEGFTSAEIAAMLGVPIGTVWTRLHHARRALRRILESST
jgi:RNA polymerase sigma factor (sigma-70 family)